MSFRKVTALPGSVLIKAINHVSKLETNWRLDRPRVSLLHTSKPDVSQPKRYVKQVIFLICPMPCILTLQLGGMVGCWDAETGKKQTELMTSSEVISLTTFELSHQEINIYAHSGVSFSAYVDDSFDSAIKIIEC
jgi:hypothetical protein